MKHAAIAAVLVGAAMLAGCKQPASDAAAPQAKDTTPKVKSDPVISQLDKFEIRPNECAGEIEKLVKDKRNRGDFNHSSRLYYDWAGDPAAGGAALDMSADKLTEEAKWHQSLDVNDDGLCDYLITTFSGASSWGQGFGISLRESPGTSLEKDFEPLPGVYDPDKDKQKYFAGGAGLPSRLGGPMPLPGTDYDQTIVYRIHPKGGGAPYIVVPEYGYTRSPGAPDFWLSENPPQDGGGYELVDSINLGLFVYRWNPKIRKFEDLTDFSASRGVVSDKTRDELFGSKSAEYWSVRAYIAERHLSDALKAFKARNFTRASLLMGYAISADPRNPDMHAWRGALRYVSGEFSRRASNATWDYDQAIAWTRVRNLPVAPILYFNQGMAYEAWCWKEMQDRREGEKPGCDEDLYKSAVAAYETYLKAAPNGERAAEAKARLADIARGIFREPQVDPEMARSADAIDRMAKAFAQARREMWQQAQAREEAERAKEAAQQKPAAALDPETGQPVGAPTRDVFKLTPADLKKIDTEINRRLRQKGKTFVQSRIDWMVAYKARFPGADLDDMIARPEHYEALPWVKKWRQTYSELPR